MIKQVLLSLCFAKSIVAERRGARLVARGGFKSDCEKFHDGLQNRPLWYKEFNVWTKSGCAHGRTYDVDFCTRVCELGHDQVCSPIAGPGVDVCGSGTRCMKQYSAEYRCQADKKDYKYDYTSYSSNDYYDDLLDALSSL